MSKIPKALAASLKKAKALLESGDNAGALDQCIQALDTPGGKSHYGVHVLAGIAARGKGDNVSAESYLCQAAEISPQETRAWQVLVDLYAQQNNSASLSSQNQQIIEDKWIGALKKLASVSQRRRKIEIKLAQALQSSKLSSNREEAWNVWNQLVGSAKKDAQMRVPLEAAIQMIVASKQHTATGSSASGSSCLIPGNTQSRSEILVKYLDFFNVGNHDDSGNSKHLLSVSLVKIVEYYVYEKLGQLSCDPDHVDYLRELKSLKSFILSQAVSVAGMGVLLKKGSLVHGCKVSPIIMEVCLLPLLFLRSIDLCSQLDEAHVEKDHLGRDLNWPFEYARFLLDEYPDRPIAHLWYACSHFDSTAASKAISRFSDAERALEHARLGLTYLEKPSFSRSVGSVLVNLLSAACQLRICDLLLAGPSGSILSGEGTANPGSIRSKLMSEVVLNAEVGLSAIGRLCFIEKTGNDDLPFLAAMICQALKVCKSMAKVRCSSPNNRGLVIAKSVLSYFSRATWNLHPELAWISRKLIGAARLCAIEACILSGGIQEAKLLCADWGNVTTEATQGEPKDFMLAANTAFLALADFHESRVGKAIDGLGKALSIYTSIESPLISSLASTHLSACLHFWLARVMWLSEETAYRNDRKHCFEKLIIAAKLRPEWGGPFGLLGQYYMTLPGQPNLTRGVKCLERALMADSCLETEGRLLASSLLSHVADSQVVQSGSLMKTAIQTTEGSESASVVNRARKVYEEAIERSGGRAAWAWRGLGTLHLNVGMKESTTSTDTSGEMDFGNDINEAIECFQSLLRIKPEDVDGWMRLGQAYALASRNTAALKSFKTALKLDPGSSKALRRMADVESAMGMLKESTMHLREALSKSHGKNTFEGIKNQEVLRQRADEIFLCNRSLAVNLLAQGRMNLASDMFLHARDCGKEGLEIASQLQNQRNDMVFLLKLAGDLNSLLGALPSTILLLKNDAHLMRQKKGSEEKVWIDGFARKKAYLEAAISSYKSVLEVHDQEVVDSQDRIFSVRSASREQLASAWMDVGVALFRLYQAMKANTSWRDVDAGEREKQTNAEGDSHYEEEEKGREGIGNECFTNPNAHLIAKTRTALRNAILIASKIDDESTKNSNSLAELAADAWNVLGVVETEMSWPPRPLVAQYAYVRCLSLSDQKHAQAWSNLGFLYLKCGLPKLALASFMTSQSLAPASSIMWCGLGVISELRSRNAKRHGNNAGDSNRKALDSYTCAMEYFPHLQAKIGIGMAAMRSGDYAKALGALQRAIDEAPCNANTRNALSLALSQTGQIELAQEELDKAIELIDFQLSSQNTTQVAEIEKLKSNKSSLLSISAFHADPLRIELSQLYDMIKNEFGVDKDANVGLSQRFICLLLQLTEERWWNQLSSFSSVSSRQDVTDVIVSLWMQMTRKILDESRNAQEFKLCLSCARFAVCIAGHCGSRNLMMKGLILLSSVLDQSQETAEEEQNAVAHTDVLSPVKQVVVFEELEDKRPRWINVLLAKRRSYHGASTAYRAILCALQVDPSSKRAWSMFHKFSPS